jgi:hypothetical protein
MTRPYTLSRLFDNVYFFTNVNGEPIGINDSSGGYPDVAKSPNDIWFISDKDNAEKYMDALNWRFKRGLDTQEYYLNQITSICGIKL